MSTPIDLLQRLVALYDEYEADTENRDWFQEAWALIDEARPFVAGCAGRDLLTAGLAIPELLAACQIAEDTHALVNTDPDDPDYVNARASTDPDHPIYVKWLGPANGAKWFGRFAAYCALRKQIRRDALARAVTS